MECLRCLKPESLCVCSELPSLELSQSVLILQHPQEQDHLLGSAHLAHLSLKNSKLKVGLSWSSLSHAWGEKQNPAEWVVLYLGSGVKGKASHSPLQFVSKKGEPIPPQENIRGLVVLDGSWSQAKALWWRNPWLLKLKRAVLIPSERSLYKELRKEPRAECLSTIESIADALRGLGQPSEVTQALKNVFEKLLDKRRAEL